MADYTFPVIRTQHPKPKPPQDKLGFANYFTDHMFEMRYDEGQGWHDGKVVPYGPISLDPASAAAAENGVPIQLRAALLAVNGALQHCQLFLQLRLPF